MSERSLVYTSDAREQLDGVSEYTLLTSVEVQEARYMQRLYSEIDQLRQYPNRGKRRDELELGLLSYRIEKHFVFYRASTEYITVIAVLHERMDPKRHLG